MPKRGGLGRGLDALIPSRKTTEKPDSAAENGGKAAGTAGRAAKSGEKKAASGRKAGRTASGKESAGSAGRRKSTSATAETGSAGKKEKQVRKAASSKPAGMQSDISEEARRMADAIISGSMKASASSSDEDYSEVKISDTSAENRKTTDNGASGASAGRKSSSVKKIGRKKNTSAVKDENPSGKESLTEKESAVKKDSGTKKASGAGTSSDTAKGAVIETTSFVETDHIAETTSVAETEPVIEEKPAVETASAIEAEAADEAASVIEAEPAIETEPVAARESAIGKKAGGEIVNMRLSLVEPNRDQPRKYFDEDAIDELADSIRQFGIISPLLVQKKDGYFEIIAGERRWRAAKKAGLKEVPVIIREFSSQEAVEVSLIENIQREDLNPIEEAKAYDRLVSEYGLAQEEVAGRVSKSRSAVANSMRLLKLVPDVQKMVETGELSEGHARTLIPVLAEDVQKKLAEQIVKDRLTVRQTEKMVKELLHPSKTRIRMRDEQREAILQSLSENLKAALGTKVSIHQSGKNKGKIEIEYYSDEELDRLYELLRAIR